MSVVETQSVKLAKRDDLGSFPYSAGTNAWIAVMLGRKLYSEVMRHAWDTSIGSDTLNSWEIREVIAARPDDDPVSVIDQSLCDFTHARQDLKELDESAQELCVPAWNGSDTSSPDLEKRVFRSNHGTTQPTSGSSTQIDTGALLQRILDTDDVPFLYSRVTRYDQFERWAPVGQDRVGRPMRDVNGAWVTTEQTNLEGKCRFESMAEVSWTD